MVLNPVSHLLISKDSVAASFSGTSDENPLNCQNTVAFSVPTLWGRISSYVVILFCFLFCLIKLTTLWLIVCTFFLFLLKNVFLKIINQTSIDALYAQVCVLFGYNELFYVEIVVSHG